jgi:hypothetical protein
MNVDGQPITWRIIVGAIALVIVVYAFLLVLGLSLPVHG